MTVEKKRVLLVCSSGGHLNQLMVLAPWLEDFDVAIATFDQPDARSRTNGWRFYPLAWPTNRRIWNNLRNAVRAWHILGTERPDLLLSAGAAPAVSFFWVSRLRGRPPTVFIESFGRVGSPTVSAWLVRPVTDVFIAQHEAKLDGFAHRVVLGPSR